MSDKGYDGGTTTGFASPAGDHLEGPIDLHEVLDLRRPNRYPVRVAGDALTDFGILHGDILIADAGVAPRHGRIAVVMIHGDVLVAQLAYKQGAWWLKPGRAGSLGTLVPHDAEIWAVVCSLIRPIV
jgi:DNA polymerase V